jgi:hypothetical protein
MTIPRAVVRSSLRSAAHSPANRRRARELAWRWVGSKWPRLLPSATELESDFIERAAPGQELRVAGSGDDPAWTLSLAHTDSRGGRTWMIEVHVGDAGTTDLLRVQTSCAGHSNSPLVVAPPRLLGLWVEHLELDDGGVPVIGEPRAVDSRQQAQAFCDHVLSGARSLPMIALSNNAHSRHYGVDPRGLAEAVRGLAHVACLSPDISGIVTQTLGPDFGPATGAARIYAPGFNALATRDDHPLIKPLRGGADVASGDPGSFRRFLVQRVCAFSVDGTRRDNGLRQSEAHQHNRTR